MYHSVMVVVVVAVAVAVVLTLTHCYKNAVRGHRTGSNSSGAEDYLRRKTNKNGRKHTQHATETNRTPQTKTKR